MDIIPIQASSVPCERVFSSGKATMAPRRSHILPHLMECLQILKFQIWKGQPLRFTEGMAWTEELSEFEHLAWTAPLGEAEAYGHSLEDPDKESDELEEALQELRVGLEELESALEDEVIDSEGNEEEDDRDDIYS